MQFTLAQLRKLTMPYTFTEEMDIQSELQGFEDILFSSMCKVKGIITNLDVDKYRIHFEISVNLILESAISLLEVPYDIFVECDEVFQTTNEFNEDVYLITNQTLDTTDAVITNILINKPMRVTRDNEELDYKNEEGSFDENPFHQLKDFLKK